ncbi:hypothetical protein [Actinomadura viridis]|uniref:hypothetical protein n=1 Tax=Actinomadura viridis TaxID=58110 RepID=UPI0018C99BDA|nr:hypothetical protein [Actinomadura viridis]
MPLVDFTPDPYVTCLDLGSPGAVFTTGRDRQVQLDGAEAKSLKETILDVIHPPLDDAEDTPLLVEHLKSRSAGEVSASPAL